MLVTVDVTQEDIDRGQRTTCRSCPIALALTRAAPEGLLGFAGPTLFSFIRENEDVTDEIVYRAITPPDAAQFMRRFDKGLPVGPFSFEADFKATGL